MEESFLRSAAVPELFTSIISFLLSSKSVLNLLRLSNCPRNAKKADDVEVGSGLLAFVGSYWLVLGSILNSARLNERFGGGCGILQRDQANLGEMSDNEKT